VLLGPAATDHPHLAWAVFQVRTGGQEFFFGSVHLAPGDGPENNALRNSEWDMLVYTLGQSGLAAGLPVVLGGDFNSPRSGGATGGNTAAFNHIPQMAGIGVPDALLGNPENPADKTLTIAQSRPATDTPGYEPKNAQCASFNGFNPAQRCESENLIGQQIDYLFASAKLPVSSWEMVLDTDDANRWIGTIPSDHNLVRATVTLPPA
jgi:endonuclease/exonuclease/phosphatase family metal-dependent hydrolase